MRAGKSFTVCQMLVYNCLIRYILKLYTDFLYSKRKKEVVSESVQFSVAVCEKRVSCAEKRTPKIVQGFAGSASAKRGWKISHTLL